MSDREEGTGTIESPIVIDDHESDEHDYVAISEPKSSTEIKTEQLDTPRPSPVKVVPGNKFRCLANSLESFSDLADIFSDSNDDSNEDDYDRDSFESSFEDVDEEILTNRVGVPIFEIPPEKYSAYAIMHLLLDPKIDENKIASRRPLECSFSASFVVDVSKLAHPDDIKKDMYGKWLHSGSHTDIFRCTYSNDDKVYIEKAAPGASGDNVYYLRRLHSVHPSNNEFRRVLALLFDSNKQPHRLCLLVYYIPDGFKPQLKPHGNSKSSKSFYPTLPSTLESIASSSSGPKEVVSDVSASVGGILGASDPCCLPRNEQQVTDVKRRRKQVVYGGCSTTDELSVVMQKAYVEDLENCFIREMKTLREPAVIIARDRQLNDMVKFCTSKNHFGIVTIDPTFCLGDFEVTITTYRHLVLQCRRSSKPPVFIGPAMIHYKKTFSTYLFFAFSLIGLRPDLSKLKCFGTDGEEALFTAFKQACPEAIHLLCSLHCRRNIKDKLRELHVGGDAQEIVIADIFGKQIGPQQIEGLVDSEDHKEFELGFEILSAKWEKLVLQGEQPLQSFAKWFHQYKSTLMKSSMLKSVRRKGGLGDPPVHFTTNASESINSVLKNKVDYKKSELPEFLDKLKSVIDEQERELERAIIDRGKYKLCEKFKKMEISEHEWFTKMSSSQREAHVKRVLSVPLESKVAAPRVSSLSKKAHESIIELSKPSCSRQLFTAQDTKKVDLSVDVSSFADSVAVPKTVLCAIWNKATELLNDSESICRPPGCNAKDRLVKSSSGLRPHLVTFKKGGQYACDNECPNWKSMGVCSHSVAAAQDNNDLSTFIEWMKKAKRSPNLTKLLLTKMPKGRGQKGGVPPRKKKKKDEVQVRKSFTEVLNETTANDDDYRCEPIGHREDSEPSGSREEAEIARRSENYSELSGGALDIDLNRSLSFHSCSGPIGSSISGPKTWSCLQGGGVSYTCTGAGSNTSLTITGATHMQESSVHLPQEPPPLVRYDCLAPVNEFELSFVVGNISVCRGCRQRYPKPAIPPLNLCIRHKEWQEFLQSGKLQQKFGNVYYHANIPCVQVRWPNFESSWVHVSADVFPELTDVHWNYLNRHLPGVQF